MEIGQAITLIMKGIHSSARPTVSLSDVVADSCLNLIGPYIHPSIHPLLRPLLSLPLSHVISFMISYNRPDRRGGAGAPSRVPIWPGDNLRDARTLRYVLQLAGPWRMFTARGRVKQN